MAEPRAAAPAPRLSHGPPPLRDLAAHDRYRDGDRARRRRRDAGLARTARGAHGARVAAFRRAARRGDCPLRALLLPRASRLARSAAPLALPRRAPQHHRARLARRASAASARGGLAARPREPARARARLRDGAAHRLRALPEDLHRVPARERARRLRGAALAVLSRRHSALPSLAPRWRRSPRPQLRRLLADLR